MAQKNENDMTKDRILNEAEAMFAQKGYRGVTVREITEAAHCNLAAVNYYFGNKWNLYLAVFQFRWLPRAKRIRENVITALEKHANPSLAEIVRALSLAFLKGPLADEERARHALLIIRELAEPTEAFELLAENALRPLIGIIANHLRPMMPHELAEERLSLNILSIFALVTYFNLARAAVTHITGQEYDEDFKTMLVEHISDFSLMGLGAIKEGS